MNLTTIMKYIHYFLSMIKNMETQNENLNIKKLSKKLKIFIPEEKNYIFISDETNMDYKILNSLNIKIYYIRPKDGKICEEFKQFTDDLQKSDGNIDFKGYENLEIEWDIFRKFICFRGTVLNMSDWKLDISNHSDHEYLYDRLNIWYYHLFNNIIYIFQYKQLNQNFLENNKNFENFVDFIDEFHEDTTSIRFGDMH